MHRMLAEDLKVTYTTSAADMDAIHAGFDFALDQVRSRLGREYPIYISQKALRNDQPPIVDLCPMDTSLVLGRFTAATAEQAALAIEAAAGAKKAWGTRTSWQERVAVIRKAASIARRRKFEIAAIMSLEVGKSRLEALGDAEEAADLMEYYALQMEENHGFIKRMGSVSPNEQTTDLLRPFGVFTCIAPFNFPMALASGMSSAALVAGNTVVFKPAQDAPWTGLCLYEVYRDAGVPADVFHFITGKGSVIGDTLWQHPKVDGIVFTGSQETGMRMFRGFSKKWVKPCLMELGGKGPAIIMDSADLDMAAEGVSKSAWGMQNQKCSATSRVYVHRKVAGPFLSKLSARTKAMRIGDPTQRDVFYGPLINEQAVKTWEKAVELARQDGAVLYGGGRLRSGPLAKGWYVEPTIVEAPLSSRLFMEEYFVPILPIGEVDSLDEALAESNKADYGLTAGIFSGRNKEIERFFDEAEFGVLYANRRNGATTGAWPGCQPFTGWKGSGSGGKGGLGPYYVAQFMREQSRTVVAD
ncbi:MAG: aldehyde dehydrogenase family protein [Elusimicrobia bacterium]|nr:aldehyde dehydrogenase family protein [Elusimicrobiota bacterium]